ncbi:MAG: LytR/AlgR family response regulator transcription factor [Blastocatellia bacterium]
MSEVKIRALIVDDEPLARSMTRRMLDGHSNIELVGESESGEEAVTAIRTLKPDLVFLDVQMPGLDGFAVIEALAPERLPQIIFITAYDQYAVRAFEVHALDYLLKPFDYERFEQALRRAIRQIETEQSGKLNERILSLLAERGPRYLERFIIKAEGRVFFLKADEIEWIEAEGNYVMLHASGKGHLFREAISSLENKLDPRKFQRIGRSAIVNLDSIRELQPWFRGDYRIILHDGTELKLSHRFRDNLNKYLGGSL